MNPYGVNTNNANISGPLVSLRILYENMPATSGCENCESVNGKDQKDWCCLSQSPSMFYVEFLKVYKSLSNSWNKHRRKDVIIRSIKNYLKNRDFNKGCVFYSDGCTCYEDRPLACRHYGIISKETWDKRWNSLKEKQGEDFCALEQCPLVSSDREVSVQDEESWFNHTKKCEERIGVPAYCINSHDGPNGSYRTFHDHLLIELFDDNILNLLTKCRLSNPTDDEIDTTLEIMKGLI